MSSNHITIGINHRNPQKCCDSAIQFKFQTKYDKFQLTIDLAHTSAIVSVSGLGPCMALSVTATAKDLEIWNISTKSIP